jgi:hypothetical protein
MIMYMLNTSALSKTDHSFFRESISCVVVIESEECVGIIVALPETTINNLLLHVVQMSSRNVINLF